MEAVTPVFEISELTAYLKAMLFRDRFLNHITVVGEISNYKKHSSGIHYFTLKDELSQLRCVMYKSEARKLDFDPRDGMKVRAAGAVSIYERQGVYQLNVEEMAEEGAGAYYRRFLLLKEKLQREGLFDASLKRPIPPYPRKIALLTSATGAVREDVRRVLSRRWPLCEVLLVPIPVQGEGAAERIAKALNSLGTLQEQEGIELCILARGGGSAEDLWPFNEEVAVRAVRNAAVPVVTAIGHETDFSLSDFAADLSAPTPSAAAEMVSPDGEELLRSLYALQGEFDQRMRSKLTALRKQTEDYKKLLSPTAPLREVREKQEALQKTGLLLKNLMEHRLLAERKTLLDKAAVLTALSPDATLDRGFSIVFDQDDHPVTDAGTLSAGDVLTLQLRRGRVKVTVLNREE